MAKKLYDVVVIGAGAAGLAAAEAAVSAGARVCVVESGALGGGHVQAAGLSSKALLAAARAYRSAHELKPFGVSVGSVSFQVEDVMKHRDRAVEAYASAVRFEERLRTQSVDVVRGAAVFEDDQTILVNQERIEARTFVLAAGAVNALPDIPGLSQVHVWYWQDVFTKKRLPKSVVVLGGGALGCEIATYYATFGTRVILLESSAQVLPQEDAELGGWTEERLTHTGVTVVTHAHITMIVDGMGGVYGVHVDVNGTKTLHAVEQIVVATGSRACVTGTEEAGLTLDAHGFISVTKEQQTNKKHIFAAGSVSSGASVPVHVARGQGMIAGYNAALTALQKRTKRRASENGAAPRVVFTDPECASVGMTSGAVKARNGNVLIGRASFEHLARAQADRQVYGHVKLIAHPKTRKLLGGCVTGPSAGELIHVMTLAIQTHLTVDRLSELAYAFPAYTEAITLAASQLTVE